MRRLVVLAFIWGWSFLFIKVAGEGLTPFTVAWARITLGAIVLHLLLRRETLRMPTDWEHWRHFAFVALAGSAVPFSLLAWGEQHITSALTAVLNASTPLFAAAFAALAGQERLRPVQIAGLGFGLFGVAVAAGVGASDLHGSSAVGAAAAIGAGVCYGIAVVYMRRHLVGIPPLVAATGQLTAGSLLIAPFALVTSIGEGVALTPSRVASILILGAVGTGIAYVLFYGLIAEVGATKAALVTYLVPVIAVAVGVVVLDETFRWRLALGGAIAVAGIAAVNVTRREQIPVPAAEPAPVTR
jgi:drug/metabolite transporter (DMT)-like permease